MQKKHFLLPLLQSCYCVFLAQKLWLCILNFMLTDYEYVSYLYCFLKKFALDYYLKMSSH